MSNENTVLSILNTFIHSSDVSAIIADYVCEIRYIYSNQKRTAIYIKVAISNILNPSTNIIRIGGETLHLVEITAIGRVYITDIMTFAGCRFLEKIPHHIIIQTNDLYKTFYNCHKFNQDISHWDVSRVTSMTEMFRGSGFNKPLNNWNVSSLICADGMFSESKFNQPLNNWNTVNLENVSYMFYKNSYNQDISDWKTYKLRSVNRMFSYNQLFNASDMFNKMLLNWHLETINSIGNFVKSNKVHFDKKNDIGKCSNGAYLITVYASDLRKICRYLGISGYSSKRKYEIIRMILNYFNTEPELL